MTRHFVGTFNNGEVGAVADDAAHLDVIVYANDDDEVAVVLKFLRGLMNAADERAVVSISVLPALASRCCSLSLMLCAAINSCGVGGNDYARLKMNSAETTLGQALRRRTREGELYEKLSDGSVRCFSCGHLCLIRPGRDGICRVRFNEGGKLLVPFNYVGALQVDPIEKKPFFHAYPGATAFSFGMLGCDYHCAYCQNWFTSQALRDPSSVAPPRDCTAEELVAMAKKYKATVMTSTYNEPLITSEWAVAVFKVAKQNGLVTSYVSNGNATPQVLDYIRPWVDLYKIDLKGFDDKHYRTLGGKLQTVLDAIKMTHERGFWVEIVTLVVPGFNDSKVELTRLAEFLVSVSPDIPWHVTAFHPDYKMTDSDSTSVEKLVWACEMGREKGLRYCYAGNIPGGVGDWENTRCHNCRHLLVERHGYEILQVNVTQEGKCPKCATAIPGRWGDPRQHQSRWQNRFVTPVR